jgi:hypothetical protein
VVVLPFLHHGQSDGSLTIRRGMVSRRRAVTEGALPCELLKWAARHPPHDRVIIVFDEGLARDPHRPLILPEKQEMGGATP